MKVSDYMQLKEQGLISNEKGKRDAGLLTIAGGGAVKGLTSLGGLALSLPEFAVRSLINRQDEEEEHPYLKAFVDSTGNKAASWLNSKIDEKLDIPEYEDMTLAQRLADFIGEGIPLFATTGGAGLIGKGGLSGAKLAARKAALKGTKTASKALGKTKPEIMQALKDTKEIIRQQTKPGFAQYLAPGYQIAPRNVLANKYRTKGLVGQQLRNAIRKEQLASLGIQMGIDVGAREGLAALTNSQGLIGNYSDGDVHRIEQIDDEIQQAETDNDISLLKGAAIATLLGFGTNRGYKFIKNLTKERYDAVASGINKTINAKNIEERYKPNADIKDLYGQVADKDRIFESKQYEGLIDPKQLDIVYSDNTATQAFMMSQRGGLIDGIDNVPPLDMEKSFREITPEQKQLLDDLARDHMLLSNSDYIRMKTKGNAPINPKRYKEIEQDYVKNLETIKADPKLWQLLNDASLNDLGLLQLRRTSREISKQTYEYLLKNRTRKGIFLYPRAIRQMDLEEPSLLDKVFYKNSSKTAKGFDIIHERQKFDFNPDTQYVSYTDDFFNKFLEGTRSVIDIGTARSTVDNILKNTPENMQGMINTKVFDDLASKWDLAQKNYIKDPTKVNSKILKGIVKDIKKETEKRTRVAYIADIKYDTNAIDRVKIRDHPYSLLNTTEDLGTFTSILEHGSTNYSKNSILDHLDDALHNPNSEWLALPNGNDGYALYKIDPHLKKALDVSPEIVTTYDEMVKFSKNMFQHMTTGNLNPLFATKSALYGTFEALTSLPLIFEKNGLDFNFTEYFKNLYYQTKATKDYVAVRWLNDTIKCIENQLKNENISLEEINTLKNALEYSKNRLKKYTLSKAERYGAVAFGEANLPNVNENIINRPEFIKKINELYGNTRGSKFIKTLRYCMDALRNSANNGLLLQLAAKQNIEELSDKAAKALVRKINRTISTTVTDTKLRGSYDSMAGRTAGFIAKDLPYGNVMIKSIASKLKNFNTEDGIIFAKAALEELKKSEHKPIDTLIALQIGTQKLASNKYIQGLVQTIAIPTTIAYLWNHKNASSRESYYQLSDYDKAGKLILVDVFGKGKHLSLPGDQECMVVSKVYETLLDSIVHGSDLQETDPAFKQSALIMQALSRSLDISNLIYPEAMLNLAGYQSNIGAETLAGEPVIKKLPRNVKNLDGTETAVQDGIFTQEARALMSTIGGALMTSLGNSAEQFKIGARDVGVWRGAKDAAMSFIDQQTRQIPLIPTERSMVYRATNQTSLENKKMRETIDTLKSLISYNKKGGATFGNRKDTNIPNLAQNKPLTPEQTSMLSMANIIVPEYNKNILPLYDKVGALYKQLNAYNATGRDVDGNEIRTSDRFEFQQKINIELQNLQKQIYTQYKLLEKMLTSETGRDIHLTDIKTLQ